MNHIPRFIWLGFVIFLTGSCTSSKKEQYPNSEPTELNESIIENPKQKEFTEREIKLVEQKKLTIFSNSKEKDEFLIYLVGETIYGGTVFFQIKNYEGMVIHNESFPSKFLIGHEFVGNRNSQEEKEEFIIERIKNFFNEENFQFPAISAEENFDEDYSDKDIWEDILSDETAVGFYYLIGEGNGRKIAYSKNNRKVEIYHYCC